MVADTMGIANLFPSFYLCICLLGIILAVIIARIPPIRLIPDTYRESVGKQINEDIPQEKGMLSYALEMSCRRAEKFTAKTVCEGGFEVMVGMFFDLIPIVALEQAVLANIVSTGLVSLLVLDEYNCAIAHSVYYGLVLLPGFEEENLHGDVVAYGVLVQLMVDGEKDKAGEMKDFLQKLGIRTTLAEMGAPTGREALSAVLKETVTGPDMEHIPYEVTEDMIYEAMCRVEAL